MATNAEKALAENVIQLFQDRDDLVVGITAALVDIYLNQIQMTGRSKPHILDSLKMQLDHCAKFPKQYGTKFLKSLIQTLREEKLDAAKLLREPPQGHA